MKSAKKVLYLAALALILIFTHAVQSEAWFWGGGGAAGIAWNSSEPPVVQDGAVVNIGDSFGGTLAIPPGATVTITGSASDARSSMSINLPVDATLIWQAELTGSSVWVANLFAEINMALLFINVDGDMDEPTGALIIEGGRIEHTADFTPDNFSVAIISGGQITMNDGISGAIGTSSDVEINGGVVRNYAGGLEAIAAMGNITINGGTISSTATMPAVRTARGSITVTGGTITSGAITPFATGDLFARGGEITVSEYVELNYPGRIRDGDTINIGEFPASNLNIPEGVTVTITGDVNSNQHTLTFNIPDDSTVVWRANTSAALFGSPIRLSGSGSFVVEDGLIYGGESSAISSRSDVDITISGGTISSNVLTIESNSSVTVAGGTISGGRISVGIRQAVPAIQAIGNVTVTGGAINSEASAINSQGDVTVTGGTINGGAVQERRDMMFGSVDTIVTLHPISASGNASISGGTINSRVDEAISAEGEITIGENAVINTGFTE